MGNPELDPPDSIQKKVAPFDETNFFKWLRDINLLLDYEGLAWWCGTGRREQQTRTCTLMRIIMI